MGDADDDEGSRNLSFLVRCQLGLWGSDMLELAATKAVAEKIIAWLVKRGFTRAAAQALLKGATSPWQLLAIATEILSYHGAKAAGVPEGAARVGSDFVGFGTTVAAGAVGGPAGAAAGGAIWMFFRVCPDALSQGRKLLGW